MVCCGKHLRARLDEFVFRFDRRRSRYDGFRCLLGFSVNQSPAACNMLIAPEPKGQEFRGKIGSSLGGSDQQIHTKKENAPMRAYVVGNVAMDETYEVAKFPKAGESILGAQRSSELGGKGANQAVVMARCGVSVCLVAAVGTDGRAEVLRARLDREPLDLHLITLPNLVTDCSIVLAEQGGENAIVTTASCAQALDMSSVIPVLDRATSGDFLVLQGNLSTTLTVELFDFSASRGMRVVFNPSPVGEVLRDLFGKAAMVFINSAEAHAYLGITGRDAVTELLRIGCETVVLTQGGKGAFLGTADSIISVPAEPCRVLDPTGAGDTFQSVAVAASMLTGRPPNEAGLRAAAKAAAVTVSSFGMINAFPSSRELSSLLSDR